MSLSSLSKFKSFEEATLRTIERALGTRLARVASRGPRSGPLGS